ncbi:MAG: 2OG-Fe(II) oxygenase [bacterium]|nr:2OG-Fe(II) oxygenase [bacterium]
MELEARADGSTEIVARYLDDAASLNARFAAAEPFPHVVLDGFLDDAFARALLAEFPSAMDASANAFGSPGRKAFHPDLQALGGAFARADRWFSSPTFLAWLGTVTGIADLRYDPMNYGGGTHENFDGRDLRPHVDFNIHPVSKLHRRVNLIVYLNEGWDASWGGSIALYRDPRDRYERPSAFSPDFNRCVIFETSERSWHGFDCIALPADQKHRSRKSLSLYFYSEDRPEHEIVEEHTTFFVPRELDARYVAGYTLTPDDERDLGELMGQRERLIALYQREQGRREPWSAEASRLRRRVAELEAARTVPVLGYGWTSDPSGFFSDGWGGGEIAFTLHASRAIHGARVRARVPSGFSPSARARVTCDDLLRSETVLVPGLLELDVPLALAAGASGRMRIALDETVVPSRVGIGPDERELGLFIERLELLDEPLEGRG